jgi:flagellin-like protein
MCSDMRKNKAWLRNKRALSPIFATLLLAAIVITFGTVAYYYASNVTKTATNNFVDSAVDTQRSVSERLGLENAVLISSDNSNPIYPPNPSPTLTLYFINCGLPSDIKIQNIFIYDDNHNLVGGHPYVLSEMSGLKSNAPIPSQMVNLNLGTPLTVGKEGYIVVKLGTGISLTSGHYTVQLVTTNGSSFVYAP